MLEQHVGVRPVNVQATADRYELAVREQLDGGDLKGDETLEATATITVAGLSRDVVVTGQMSLA